MAKTRKVRRTVRTHGEAVDRSFLTTLRDLDGDGTIVRLVLGEFLQETPVRLQALEDSVTRRETLAVARAAHALRGMCGSLGARDLGGLAGLVEDAARDNRLGVCLPVIERMKAEYERVRVTFEAELQSLATAGPRS